MKDIYCYKIIADEKTIKFIRSRNVDIELLFPEKQFDQWSSPTNRELETELLDVLFSRPEMAAEVHFRNTECDELALSKLRMLVCTGKNDMLRKRVCP